MHGKDKIQMTHILNTSFSSLAIECANFQLKKFTKKKLKIDGLKVFFEIGGLEKCRLFVGHALTGPLQFKKILQKMENSISLSSCFGEEIMKKLFQLLCLILITARDPRTPSDRSSE